MTLRVLIADDMQSSYQLLDAILNQAGGFDVVGWAKDGKEVVSLTAELRPDIVTMDVDMPKQSGLEAIREIMSSTPTPILVVSSHASNVKMNLTFNALHEGALDVLEKPPAFNDPSFPSYVDTLTMKLLALSEVKLVKRRAATKSTLSRPPATHTSKPEIELVALGTSAGGPQALSIILSQLPKTFPHPIVVVQHIVGGFIAGMVDWLEMQSAIHIKVAEHSESLLPGIV